MTKKSFKLVTTAGDTVMSALGTGRNTGSEMIWGADMLQLLQNAVYGTAMILTVAVLRRVLKDRLAPGARLALWAACLFRLLTPAAPESVLSLWGIGRWFARETQDAPVPAPVVPVSNGAGAFVPAAPEMTVPAVPAPQPAPEIPWETILLALWAAVGIALAVRYALSYLRTRRAVGCAVPIGRDDPRYAPLPRYARLREGVMEGAPLTFGAVRPTVVLSPGLAGEELACVLAHEGVHARRRDNLWHYVTALALVVHWWNPAVWLMARLLRRDVELSCDRAAVKKLGADRRAEYANALISMATQGKDPAFCQTFGRKAAEERVISIMKYKKATIVGTALTLALVLAVSVGFASDPAADVPGEDDRTVEVDQTAAVSEGDPSVNDGGEPPIEELLEKNLDGTAIGKPDYVEYPETPRETFLAEYEAHLSRCIAEGTLDQSRADRMLADLEDAVREADEGKIWDLKFNKNAGSGEFGYVEDISDDPLPEDPAGAGDEPAICGYPTAEDLTDRGDEPAAPTADNETESDPVSQSPWPVNSKGQTYGNAEIIDGKHPDLVVCWKNHTTGELCYARYEEYMYGGYPGTVNDPEEAMEYMAWLATQPSETVIPVYDSEGNVTDELRMFNPLADPALQTPQLESCPVCTVEGCAIEGRHGHNGVTYCGGEAHHAHGETTCDGSCLYCAQQAVADGHHSDSHH